MFTVIGCLGSIAGVVDSVDQAVAIVQSQVPISTKKVNTTRNALERLAAGRSYEVDYGGSGCTVRRS